MDLQELMNKPLPQIPDEIKAAIGKMGITLTSYEDKNEILRSASLQAEAGYRFFDDGSALVSMYCPMPGITAEMINWWFWWHVQENIRYQIWFPGAHYANSYSKKNAAYFSQPTLPPFEDNDQYPKETVGSMTSQLVIHFVKPEEMGFDPDVMKEDNIPVIVCGHVGLKGLFNHTEMAHCFRQTADGLYMFSRFWMGTPIKIKPLRKIIMTDAMVRGMAEHCCIEYRNLAEILPGLYEEYGKVGT